MVDMEETGHKSIKMNDIINQIEARSLEFKGKLPTSFDLAKTIVAFANDAGGEIYIGTDNNH